MFFPFRNSVPKRNPRRKPAARPLILETLEDRTVPSTFTVSTLASSGAGSLRQAIQEANAHPGADVIQFDVAGTIELRSALPAITGTVNIDGSTAPGFAGTPVVEIDFNGFAGLTFDPGAAGSALQSLALDNAAGNGVTIHGAGNMFIAGNFIGLALDGSTAAGNAGNGLVLDGSSGDTIGGSTGLDRNVISGNGGDGILLERGASNNTITNNFIGTNVTGTLAVGNDGNGIALTNSSANLIGGTAPEAGNLIAWNEGDGVFVSAGNRNGLSENSIVANDQLGIELGAGANRNQAAPVLDPPQFVGSGFQVSGTLSSTPKTTFTIDLFASEYAGSSGQYFLGSETVKTNAAGLATFTVSGPMPPGSSRYITATATDPLHNTSEFSAPVCLLICP